MGERILIVEDNPMVASALNFKLCKEGYDVIVCSDGTSAIELVKTIQFNLILIDLVLPFTSGMNVIKWVKTEFPFLPVIVLSAAAEKNIITRTYLLGASDFIAKPFDPLLLSSSIRDLLKSA